MPLAQPAGRSPRWALPSANRGMRHYKSRRAVDGGHSPTFRWALTEDKGICAIPTRTHGGSPNRVERGRSQSNARRLRAAPTVWAMGCVNGSKRGGSKWATTGRFDRAACGDQAARGDGSADSGVATVYDECDRGQGFRERRVVGRLLAGSGRLLPGVLPRPNHHKHWPARLEDAMHSPVVSTELRRRLYHHPAIVLAYR
jgi:hypothetical protein